MSDPTAARENIQVELACPSVRPAPSKQAPQKQESRNGFEPGWIVKGCRRDGIVSPAGGLGKATIYVNKRRPLHRAPTAQVNHHVGANNSYI